MTSADLKNRIMLCNLSLKELRSSGMSVNSDYYRDFMRRHPDLTMSDYARMLEDAIKRTTKDLHALQADLRALNDQQEIEPVSVGLKPAKLVNQVPR